MYKVIVLVGNGMAIEEKKQISYGRLITQQDFSATRSIPDDVKSTLEQSPYYLFIYIPGDELLKISVFPCQNASIKKILIRLKEFSPDLVKGISDVLKNFKLGDGTIHTTGLCFSSSSCYYETYIDAINIQTRDIDLKDITNGFLQVPRVEKVDILDIEIAHM